MIRDFFRKEAPLRSLAGLGGGIVSKLTAGEPIVEVNIRFDVYGGKGGDYTFDPNYPNFPANDPRRKGGLGGFTRVDMTVPTAYVVTPNIIPAGSPSNGATAGGAAGGFGINNEWMVVAGGGAGANGKYDVFPAASPPIVSNSSSAGGAGEGGITGSGAGQSSAPQAGRSQSGGFNTVWTGAVGGAGAPAGTPGPNQNINPASGGKGNIRIREDQGITNGVLNVNPDWSMNLVSSNNGTSSSARVVITNLDTGKSTTLSGDLPVADIKNLP